MRVLDTGGPRTPWSQTPGDVAASLGVDPDRGLSDAEAARRHDESGPNELPSADPPGRLVRFVRQFRDPLVALLLIAIVISVAVWLSDGTETVPVDAIVIALVVLANASIGTWQEGRAIDAVAALRRLTRPRTTVRRGGHPVEIDTADVVVGDVLVAVEGDAVTADARVIDESGLEVDESALTGESVPVRKRTNVVGVDTFLADRSSMLHSGTSITRGHATAVVTSIGVDTELGRIAGLVGDVRQDPTPLQRQITTLSRQLAFVVAGIALALVAAVAVGRGIDSGGDLLEVLLAAIALAVAAVPEGLPAIMAVVLALGVQRMARQRAIVKRLVSVETLGATTVICTDKTGTLTRNEMTVVAVATPGCEATLTGVGYDVGGRLVLPDDATAVERAGVECVLDAGAASSNATLDTANGSNGHSGDPTELALVVAARKAAAGSGGRCGGRFGRRLAEMPFDGERKMMSVVVESTASGHSTGGTPGAAVQITKGAPEVVLDRCSHVQVDGAETPITDTLRHAVEHTVERWAARGLRTLAVATRLPSSVDAGPNTIVEDDLTFLGTVAIVDPLRPSAVRAVGAARRAGVEVRMITGDHPATAAAIAAELEIDHDRVLTGRQLDELDDASRADGVATSSVLARVTPLHKLDVVAELRRRGEVVAMTGDGVNDAPALRSADIGVAMGRSGTDVARDASDIILTDDDFGTIVEAVREGRQIYDNIRKFLRYLLATNAGEVVLMIAGVLAAAPLGLAAAGDGAALPLLATQILWINLVTDAAPALALGVDPSVDDVMSRPPRPPEEPVIDAAMWSTIAVIGAVTAIAGLAALDLGLAGGLLGGSGDVDHGRTMAFTTVVLAQGFNAFNARSVTTSAFVDMFTNRLLVLSVAVAVVAQVAVVEIAILNESFSTVPLSALDWVVCVALSALVLVASEIHKALRRRSLRERVEPSATPT